MNKTCPSKINLEAFFLGEPSKASLSQHVSSCLSCQEKLKDWESDRKAFLIQYPFERFLRTAKPYSNRRSWLKSIFSAPWRNALVFASITGLALLFVWQSQQHPEILSKGGPSLTFYTAQGNEVHEGHDSMSLPFGTSLQFVSSTTKENYLLLLGVEEDKTINVYFPYQGSQSASVTPGTNQRLPQALRWEPKSGYERFYALFSKEPVTVSEAKTAIENALTGGKRVKELFRIPLPYSQTSIILYRKDAH